MLLVLNYGVHYFLPHQWFDSRHGHGITVLKLNFILFQVPNREGYWGRGLGTFTPFFGLLAKLIYFS